MAIEQEPIPAVVLAPPQATASTLFGVYDLLGAAGREWQFIVLGEASDPLFAPRVLSRDGEPFVTGAGVRIHPHGAYDDAEHPKLVTIPDVVIGPNDDPRGRFDREIECVLRWYEEGAVIATACTGALLLAEAGLLDGGDATIHWGYCDAMARRYPRVNVRQNCALVTAGPGHRLVMAGGGSSWQDLTLYLVARFAGVEEAMRVARVFLMDWHYVGQQPFVTVAHRQTTDGPIAKCQRWIAANYRHSSPVAEMATISGLSERSFKRRFAKATGLSPLEYVHSLRLEEAKRRLESSAESIESIANEVGYEDTSFFGRLFRRQVGLTPAQYRKRFGGLRETLAREISAA